jgi:uncharacterized protein YhaN
VVERTGVEVDLSSIPQTVKELMERTRQAREHAGMQSEIRKQIEQGRRRVAQLDLAISQAEADIASLMQAAGCASMGELEKALERCEQAERLRQQLSDLEDQLLHIGDGLSLPELTAEAAEVPVDRVAGELDSLEESMLRLEQEREELNRSFGATEREYQAKVEGTNAAALEAAEHAQDILAQLAAAVERYLKLRMAATVLRRAIERFREEHQDPVLTRAGEIFRQLTEGSFSHLVVDYDEKDNPVIKGVRGGEQAEIEGMSDGTQDQLYLALRLASIELYLAKKEPIPFILDDVLINFDDHRTAAALRAFAQLAERTQVIMFTHHVSLVQLAKNVLPENSFALYVLGGTGLAEPLSGEAVQVG